MMSFSDKRLGLLAGFLCGDALGRPFNGLKGGHIQQLAGGDVEDFPADPVLFPKEPERNCLAGVHSVLGQEFLAMVASIHPDETGRDAMAMWATFVKDLHGADDPSGTVASSLRRPGHPLSRALERWARDYPWEAKDHFALEEASEGASCCARAIAAALADDPGGYEAARLTHLKEAPLAGAFVVWRTARSLLETEDAKKIDVRSFVGELQQETRTFEDSLRTRETADLWTTIGFGRPVARLSDALPVLPSLIESGDDVLAERTLLNQAREFGPDRAVTHAQHGFAAAMVPWTLYRALGPASTPIAMMDAVNRGGRTSLAAALIGGLAGARHGIDSVPPEWLEGLRIWPRAKALLENPSEPTVEAWLAAERALGADEEKFRAPLREKARKARLEAGPERKKPKKPAPETAEDRGELPFAPSPQAWLEEKGNELAPWEKQRLKAERGRKRIEWKEDRRKGRREGGDVQE